VEIADRVAGKALALLTLTRSFTSFKPDREECLLAEAMGYFAYAETLAATLAESDLARLYVLRDDQRLRDAASAGGSAPSSFPVRRHSGGIRGKRGTRSTPPTRSLSLRGAADLLPAGRRRVYCASSFPQADFGTTMRLTGRVMLLGNLEHCGVYGE
jgi:hypothetical protein